MSNPKYKPARLATLPPTLDPAEYDISPETRKAQAERLAIRSRLKREYLLQYNNPNRHGLIVSGGRRAGTAGRSRDAPLRRGSPDPPRGPGGGGPPSRISILDLALVQARRAGLLTSPFTWGGEFGGG
ncbi:hypothetical protein QTO34_014490 [Cnephaeus nilssonii]|uniref:NADH dehydrogenase [ubiquinone] 1 beta subcomplex subunit 4 n=1 Tax=Cnephaeus nilssonii TaxID=3371016 RepID=A0AA40LUC1_CNENI|nr:hypothetical protein QTO34_014490 [Eptesicus nilssonii]